MLTFIFVFPVKTSCIISFPVTGSGILTCFWRGNCAETSSKDPTPFLNAYPVLGSIATSATSSNIGIILPPLPLPDVNRSFNSIIIWFCILGSAILLPATLPYFLATSLVTPSIVSFIVTASNKSASISPRLALLIKNWSMSWPLLDLIPLEIVSKNLFILPVMALPVPVWFFNCEAPIPIPPINPANPTPSVPNFILFNISA